MMQQLPLGVRLRPVSTFETFVPGDNTALLLALHARATGRGAQPVWLWGNHGSGRTHLLQALCAAAAGAGRRAAYLPLGDPAFSPDQLGGLETLDLVCLDDAGVVAERGGWQAALFGLYQGLNERQADLVISAATAPATLSIPLPDLASRLRAAEVWQLRPLPEPMQGEALTRRAQVLGLTLPPETLIYLQRRLPRDFASLCDVLDRLDDAALRAQRQLTVPFVRGVLDELG